MTADLIIRGARIVDGTGGAAFEGDVAIEGDRIAQVGSVSGEARETIDGEGLILSPGFIDVHTHDDFAFLRHPDMGFKLFQGVTTCVCGNCGFSAIPSTPGADPLAGGGGIFAGAGGEFTDLNGYFASVMAGKPSINAIMLAGHNTIRAQVMGLEERAPTKPELDVMRGKVREARFNHVLALTSLAAAAIESELVTSSVSSVAPAASRPRAASRRRTPAYTRWPRARSSSHIA